MLPLLTFVACWRGAVARDAFSNWGSFAMPRVLAGPQLRDVVLEGRGPSRPNIRLPCRHEVLKLRPVRTDVQTEVRSDDLSG